jgi:hypothetical protein
LKHDPFESLLFAVALGVGLTREFLPMISSLTLARGAMRIGMGEHSRTQLAADLGLDRQTAKSTLDVMRLKNSA